MFMHTLNGESTCKISLEIKSKSMAKRFNAKSSLLSQKSSSKGIHR